MRRCLPLVLIGLAGCGNDRTPAIDVDTPARPSGERVVRLGESGVRFRAPGNWPDLPAAEPRVGGIRSGRANVAVWRYVRSQELPETRAGLERVRDLLLGRVRERDPGFEATGTRIVRRGGAPGVEIVGEGTIGGRPVRIRSAHLFARDSEYVIDAYSPPEHFERVDETVFRPLLRSLRIRPA